MLSVRAYALLGSLVVRIVGVCFGCWRVDSLFRESTSPFIDEGDGLTRERVRMLLSLVAQAGGYKMMVSAHISV